MFETLNDKFEKIVRGIRGKAVISESDLDSTLREIRIALLEADVALVVVKDFINSVKENILGKEVLKSIKPDQMIIKLVQDELVNILGSEKSVKSFSKEQVINFVKRNYTPERAVLSSVGGINHSEFERLADRHASNWKGKMDIHSRTTPFVSNSEIKHVKKEIHQSHIIIGGEGISIHDKDYTAIVLLNNLLGGPSMNSRLNLNIRERHGIAYQIESFINSYNDSGIWGIYAGTDLETIDRCHRLIIKELTLLRDKKLGVLQFSKAKTQLLGQMALAQESNVNMMTSLGKSLLVYNRVDTFKEIVTKVDALKISQIQELAQQIFSSHEMSELRYVPLD